MSTNDGGPAFPKFVPYPTNEEIMAGVSYARINELAKRTDGMTLRDYFAAAVMQGLAVGHAVDNSTTPEATRARFAVAAYATADAMLKERDK